MKWKKLKQTRNRTEERRDENSFVRKTAPAVATFHSSAFRFGFFFAFTYFTFVSIVTFLHVYISLTRRLSECERRRRASLMLARYC